MKDWTYEHAQALADKNNLSQKTRQPETRSVAAINAWQTLNNLRVQQDLLTETRNSIQGFINSCEVGTFDLDTQVKKFTKLLKKLGHI